MFQKIILALLFCITYSFADFKNITPNQLQSMIDKNVVVIDIRTPPEWIQTGVVPTSKKIMFFDEKGGYDVQLWLNNFNKFVKNKNQPFVLVCRTGNRTGTVGNFLSQKLQYKNVYHLENGIVLWKKENRKISK